MSTFFSYSVYNKIWFYLLILCLISILLLYFYKNKISPQLKPSTEAFTQKENFVLKYGDHGHDDMYCTNYEKIHKIKTHIPQQIDILLKTTQPSQDDVILDIGSTTGYVVNELTQRGYNAYGVTPLESFVNYCNTKYPDAIVKQGNIRNPMEYEKGIFTHIFALYYTIYNYNREDKMKIFKNCYSWMKPGGYLVLHLVDVQKFDITTPIAKDPIFGSLQKQHFAKIMQKENKSTPPPRLTEFEVEFQDMIYKSNYDFNRLTTTSEVTLIETMKNKGNEKIRQNEKMQYMEPLDQILQMASQCGFITKSILKLKEILDDEYQFLYIFERTL
jgi:SAM-dependent methyltransferase